MIKTFEQNFIVALDDIMPSFGMKATAALKYFQETYARYCAEHNVAGYNLYKMGLKWVFGQTIVEYFDVVPIWNEKIITKVYIASVKKLRFYINFEIKTNRGLVAKGQSVAYTLDLSTSRPMPVEDIVSKFLINEENRNGEVLKYDFENDGNLVTSQEHKITFSDIDYNGHTNNISYVSFGFEGMPETFIRENRPKILDVRYLQETFLDDVLKCEIYQNDNKFNLKILNSKDNSEVCLINSYWQKSLMTPEKFFEILDEIKGFVSV